MSYPGISRSTLYPRVHEAKNKNKESNGIFNENLCIIPHMESYFDKIALGRTALQRIQITKSRDFAGKKKKYYAFHRHRSVKLVWLCEELFTHLWTVCQEENQRLIKVVMLPKRDKENLTELFPSGM